MSCFTQFKNIFFKSNNESKEIEKETIIKEEELKEEVPSIIKWEDTVQFTFPITGGQVIKVYDGDTITIATRLPFNESPLYRLSVRLNGIDCPEIKGKDVSDEEKAAAVVVKDYVASLILHKYVKLENIQNEKYGRVLADVYINDIHLNGILIEQGYAVKYDGGTKHKPVSWSEHRIQKQNTEQIQNPNK
jgi:micrococcal nuclease